MFLGVPAVDGVVVALLDEQPLLAGAPVAATPHEREAAVQLVAVEREVQVAGRDRGERIVTLDELHVPQSHTMTSPPPYSPAAMTPSKS